MTTNQKIAEKFRELAELFESLDDNSSGSPAQVIHVYPPVFDDWKRDTPSTGVPLPPYTLWGEL